MVRIIGDSPVEHKRSWDTEQTRECCYSYDDDNANDRRIMSLINHLIDDNQPTCDNCSHHYYEMCMNYEAIQCRIHGNIEYIENPHYDMDGSKCPDYKRK